MSLDDVRAIGGFESAYCAPVAALARTLSDRTDCDAAMLSAKLVKNAELKIYKGAPHGMCTTEKDKVNQDLLAFIGNAKAQRAA